MKKGTLIRVTTDRATVGGENLEANGELWIVENTVDGGNTVYAKALATGMHYVWYENEYEVSNEGAEQ